MTKLEEIGYLTKIKCNLKALPENYVVLDLETTGFSPRYDEITNIAAIRYEKGEAVSSFNSFVKTTRPLSDEITELTGITNEMLSSAPGISQVLYSLLEFVDEDDLIMGHNVGFDMRFLQQKYVTHLNRNFFHSIFDTRQFSQKYFPELDNYKLITLMTHFKIRETQSHQALDDCEMCNACYKAMREDIIRCKNGVNSL